MPAELPLDADRLWADVMALAEITDPERPYTRRSFSPLFLKGRAWLARAVRGGRACGPHRCGRQSDRAARRQKASARRHRRSDRTAIPCRRAAASTASPASRPDLKSRAPCAMPRVRLDHTLEIIDFLAEEPSDYGLSCVGSRGMSGSARSRNARYDGARRRDACARRCAGSAAIRIASPAARRSDIKAFLELHIEQGIVLELQSLDVGIVTSIVGIRRIEITFEGAADHAGTTPMALRHDALVAAANTVVSVRRIAEQLAAEGPDYFVATVGILNVEPGGIQRRAGTMPAGHRRAHHQSGADRKIRRPRSNAKAASMPQTPRVSRAPLVTLSDGPPAACDPRLRADAAAAAPMNLVCARPISPAAPVTTPRS